MLGEYSAEHPVFYEDEVDIHLNPAIGADWQLRRQQKRVVTPGQNENIIYNKTYHCNAEFKYFVRLSFDDDVIPSCYLILRSALLRCKIAFHKEIMLKPQFIS